jgi:hypothetical protein
MCWLGIKYQYPPTHVKTQNNSILASIIYFDSDMSKSTNTVVYFDWKTVIYIYVCGKCRTQFMLPMEKSVTFTGACANEIKPSINRSFVYKAEEGRYVRIMQFSYTQTLIFNLSDYHYTVLTIVIPWHHRHDSNFIDYCKSPDHTIVIRHLTF